MGNKTLAERTGWEVEGAEFAQESHVQLWNVAFSASAVLFGIFFVDGDDTADIFSSAEVASRAGVVDGRPRASIGAD